MNGFDSRRERHYPYIFQLVTGLGIEKLTWSYLGFPPFRQRHVNDIHRLSLQKKVFELGEVLYRIDRKLNACKDSTQC